MKNKPSYHLICLAFAAILVTRCSNNLSRELQIQENSISTNTVAEPIYINNCGGSARVEQVSQHSQTVTIEGEAELGVNTEVVNDSLERKYISTKGITKSQKVIAAPNTNMKFVLLWTEQISEGIVTSNGFSGQATYRVSVPISVEQLSAENLGCSQLVSPTTTSIPIKTPTSTSSGSALVQEQLTQIDQALKQSITASIAYNAPATMKLDESTTIELLLNPTVSPQALSTQITESGQVVKGSIEITPQMKAVLKAQEQDAFDIQPLHDNPEQVISGTDTTNWSWFVTAKKAGLHRLTIVIYRLVKFDGQDYWREVETYKADIDIKVTFGQWVRAIDWKWVVGIIIPLIGIPSLWGYFANRKKKKRTK